MVRTPTSSDFVARKSGGSATYAKIIIERTEERAIALPLKIKEFARELVVIAWEINRLIEDRTFFVEVVLLGGPPHDTTGNKFKNIVLYIH